MLAIQPINVARSYTFKSAENLSADNFAYPKDKYESDKTQLEEHLEEINEVIENTQMPKPLRALGKLASIVIGGAIGFVSMKYGAQGVVKLCKKGIDYCKKLAQRPFAQKLKSGCKNLAHKVKVYNRALRIKFVTKFKNSEKMQKVVNKFVTFTDKFKNTKFANKAENVAQKIDKTKSYQFVKNTAKKAVEKVKGITGENIENGVINLFAISGGVTGAITALQGTAKEQE